MLSQLKLGSRLTLGFGSLLALLCLTSLVAVWQMGRLRDNSNYYAVNLVPSYQAQNEIGITLGALRSLEFRHVLADTDREMDDIERQIAADRATVSADFATYARDLVSDDEDKRDMERAESAVQAYYAEWERIRPVSRLTTTDPSKTGQADRMLLGPSADAYGAAQDAIAAWWRFNVKLSDLETGEARSTYARANWIMGVLAALAVTFGITGATLITRSITRPIAQAARLAKSVAAGDLTSTVSAEGGDEASDLLRTLAAMQESLESIVTNVRRGAEIVATASAQISIGNQDLSKRTEVQAAALEETGSTMEELTSAIRNNAASSQEANRLAIGASGIASQGGRVVSEVVETMSEINAGARKIAEIISVVDGIAFQTNLLALNAAVEAARAGEQGRGFAVVASEVRSLAQRSAAAAREIKILITGSVERVDKGSALVEQAGRTMAEVVGAIQRVGEVVAEISAANLEQSNGVQEVGKAVLQMDQATQQNAALVEESATAAENLREQAAQLLDAVGVFRLSPLTGQAAAPAAVHRSTADAYPRGLVDPTRGAPRRAA